MRKVYLKCFLLISIFMFSIFACNHKSTNNKQDVPPKPSNPVVPTETAKLKSLKVGKYEATDNDMIKASKQEGFPIVFKSDVSTVEIDAVPEDGGSIDFGTYATTINLTETVQTIIFKVKKAGKSDGTYTLKLSKEAATPPNTTKELNNLRASDFLGVLPKGEEFNVINSVVSWDAFDGATHYDVFIEDKRTNENKLTNTKFKTAEGVEDLDKLMGEEEKDIKITVKALDDDQKVLAESSITKKLPKKGGIENVLFNDTPYTKDMKVTNPLTIKVKFHNNPVKFYDDTTKMNIYLNSHMNLMQGTDVVPVSYSYDETENTMTITPTGGLNEIKKYNFVISKDFNDKFDMSYSREEKSYALTIEKSPNPAPTPDVLKILINDDTTLDIKTNEKTDINVESTISIYFNQLIYQPSYEVAGVSEGGNKGNGIFISKKATGTAGDDPSRLTEGVWKTVIEDGKPVTKVTFKMVGKLNYYSTNPLDGNTKYYIVIDEPLRTVANVRFTEKRFNFTTGKEKPVLYSFEVQNGEIIGETTISKTKTELKAGDKVKIKPIVPEGKKFDSWNIGKYSSLTEEQKKTEELEYTMIAHDVTLYATFK
ncbi:MAG: InlB B-repeat-containing protein [Treponema sp.]